MAASNESGLIQCNSRNDVRDRTELQRQVYLVHHYTESPLYSIQPARAQLQHRASTTHCTVMVHIMITIDITFMYVYNDACIITYNDA